MDLAALVVFLVASAPTGASPEIHEETVFYGVVGRTADELREAMKRAGPVGPDGKRQDAVASWKVRYTYKLAARTDGCGIGTLAVMADISTTLPRWMDKPRTESLLTERWENHVAALKANLEPIREIGRRAAAALHDTLSTLPTRPRCEGQDEAIASVADAVIQHHVRENDEYDKHNREHPSEALRFP